MSAPAVTFWKTDVLGVFWYVVISEIHSILNAVLMITEPDSLTLNTQYSNVDIH
jgi:hypothetical protein